MAFILKAAHDPRTVVAKFRGLLLFSSILLSERIYETTKMKAKQSPSKVRTMSGKGVTEASVGVTRPWKQVEEEKSTITVRALEVTC
jgi:hypothetical protein